eukprot:scaffold9783_cov113-Cylindrotheca_fusiformis.AAC.3
MASQEAQNRANALNAKIEAEAGIVLDDLEKNLLRKIARESFACAVKCYDKAGNTGPQQALEQCARSCQNPYQQSTNLVQNVCETHSGDRVDAFRCWERAFAGWQRLAVVDQILGWHFRSLSDGV